MNNSVSSESRFPKKMTQHSNFSLRATHDRAASGNGTTVHNASHVAARNTKVAADSSGEKLVPAAGSVTSDVTLTAALWDIAQDRGNTSLQF
jgi:hypothetical protein